MTQPLAFFDLDDTLIDADCEMMWTDFLHDRGIVDSAFMRRIHRFDIDYMNGRLDYYDFDRTILSPLQPFTAAECETLLQEYLALLQPRIRTWMLAVVDENRHAGRRVVMATASNSYLAEHVAKLLGFSELICTRVEIIEGKPTGEIVGAPAFRDGKVHRLQEWAEENALSFAGSWGYSDSHNDIPLLNLVEHPVAVTPDPVLRLHARRSGWDILQRPDGHKK